MPTYVLEPGTAVHLPKGPLSVFAQVVGSRGRLDVVGGDAPPRVIRPTPQLVIVPHVAQRLVLRAVPEEGGRFPPGATVALTVGIDQPADHDPERAQLPASDVSGLAYADLVVVAPQGSGFAVEMAVKSAPEVLPELVALARAATREVLGTDRVPDADAFRMVVELDASASGRRMVERDGLAVLEVLLGVSRVVADGAQVPSVALVSDQLTWVDASGIGEVRDSTAAVLGGLASRVGFRSAHPDVRGPGADRPVVAYVVTDGVPADVDALAQGDATGRGSAHLVLVGPAGADHGAPAASLPWTAVEAVRDTPLARRLTSRPQLMTDLVRSLLQGCFPPGTEIARRVAR